jgi:hypothetical protein
MKNFLPFIAAIIVAVSFASCQKEVSFEVSSPTNNNNGNNSGGPDGTQTGTTPSDITGEWEFVKAYIKTKATVSVSMGGQSAKDVTTTEYTTTDNHGTMTIGTDKMTTKDVGYSASTMLYLQMYENNKLMSIDSLPFNFTMPNSSGESPYKRVNADSVYFESGFISMDKDKLTSIPSGARIKIDAQGILSFAMSIYQTKTDNSSGIPQQMIQEATTITYFKRK